MNKMDVFICQKKEFSTGSKHNQSESSNDPWPMIPINCEDPYLGGSEEISLKIARHREKQKEVLLKKTYINLKSELIYLNR